MTVPMAPARIPYRQASVLPAGIPPLNLFRMLAHSPATLPHILSLGTVCFRDTSLSPYLRELVCLRNATRLACEYQWRQHIHIAKSTGVRETQIAAIASGDISGDMWSPEEKALLHFLDAVIDGPEISEPVFSLARKHFTDQLLVEVVTIQGYYYSLARIVTVFHVDVELPGREDPIVESQTQTMKLEK